MECAGVSEVAATDVHACVGFVAINRVRGKMRASERCFAKKPSGIQKKVTRPIQTVRIVRVRFVPDCPQSKMKHRLSMFDSAPTPIPRTNELA